MTIADPTRAAAAELPRGFAALPLFAESAAAPLRIAVLVKKEADPAGGSLVVLRENLDGRVFLGCVQDAGGRILDSVELWVQSAGALRDAPAPYRRAANNALLDERWREFVQALGDLDAGGLILTGWEQRHPLPSFLNAKTETVVHPVGPKAGSAWRLCEDDALLRRHDLPPYSASLHRYLYLSEPDGNARFVPVTPDAPAGAATATLADILPPGASLVPLNPEGGLLAVRRLDPLSLEEYLGVLNGGVWAGIPHGRAVVDLGGAGETLGTAHHPGRLFLAAAGRGGRLIETLRLKIGALADMIRSVRALVARQQRPLLNLGPESFRVRFAEPGGSLPLLWTARIVLAMPGEAIPVAIESADLRFYLRAREGAVSIYRPEGAGAAGAGRAEARIRQARDTGRGLVIEGTLRMREDIAAETGNLLWLRLTVGAKPVDCYGHIERDAAMAQGEWRFRTVEQRFPPDAAARIRAAEGVPIPNAPFELIPVLGAWCDLYALAVLGARILLVNRQAKLSTVLDDLVSLARESGALAEKNPDLPAVIAGLFAHDARWSQALGPQRLIDDELAAEEAFAFVPSWLWWRVLAMVVRMLPGISAYSASPGAADPSAGAAPAVFDRVLQDADELLNTTGSLIVTDWGRTREIRDVIDARSAKESGARAS